IIFGTLYTRSNFWIAAILSSFIFGLIHQEFEHILIYTSMGFVFAFLYVKTKSILTPIIVHIVLNSFSIIMQYSLDPEDFERMRQQWENIQTILIVLIGGCFFNAFTTRYEGRHLFDRRSFFNRCSDPNYPYPLECDNDYISAFFHISNWDRHPHPHRPYPFQKKSLKLT